MKIYTKTGDNGTSCLIGGTSVPKDDIRLEAYGSIDELNSFLGLLAVEQIESDDAAFVRVINHQLFKIGSFLATDQSVTSPKFSNPVSEDMLRSIEEEIDKIVTVLPELHQFVIPGGNKASAVCHICRSICRRAERQVVKVSRMYNTDENILIFLNRLSDYLFVLGRKACIKDSDEIFWDQSK